ncbi:MAG: hypothetical protein A2X94_02015 [Bdellovibrionales bacterium GWB1_55_8]|nr:MAG: hypothetical protein A2X94_02015 [Bdellovibrionales bacterium GWB1_55_8]
MKTFPQGLIPGTAAAVLSTLLASTSFAAPALINVSDRVTTTTYFRDRYASTFGNPSFGVLEEFHSELQQLPKKVRKRARSLIAQLDPIVPERILLPLVHWRVAQRDPGKVAQVLQLLAATRLLTLRDFVDHPTLGTPEQKTAALAALRELTGNPGAETLSFFEPASALINTRSERIAALTDDADFIRTLGHERLFAERFNERLPFLPDRSYSWQGFIPGNRVELVSHNRTSMDRLEWLNQRVIFGGAMLDWSAPHMRMSGPGAHPAFNEDPIFMRIREMIDRAEDSIFIDIFLFGGTMGGTLARHLIDKTLEKRAVNPKFRTLLLHDFATNYNMKEEMMPVFEYIRDRIRNEPEVRKSVLLIQANIQRHPPGIPFNLTSIVPKTDAVFREIEKRNTYFESKIDHSKVIVIDANTQKPEAYFGSKNWSDHSGAYYYDNALYVAGPAAAAVQASYYEDLAAALTSDSQERKWFYFKEQGFGNDHHLPARDEILNWFRIKQANYPAQGNQSVRLAEADVDGTVKDVRNILIDMIARAQHHIYMEQLFLYDKYIVDALIKRKLQNPNLDIRILADHNGNFGMNGFPNTIFLRELASYGITVRARRTVGITTTLPNGEKRTYHQENHRKITSVDGAELLAGSSNLNPDTLQGSFREFGAQVFDPSAIQSFESYFMEDWASDDTMELETENMELKVGTKELSPQLSALLNDLGAMLLRSKDAIEKRD